MIGMKGLECRNEKKNLEKEVFYDGFQGPDTM